MNNGIKINRITKTLMFIFPCIAMAGLLIPVLIGKPRLSLLGTYLAIPLLLAPFVYFRTHNNSMIINIHFHNKRYFKLCTILFLVISIISISILCKYPIRTMAYYFLISILATILLIQILLFNLSRNNIIIILIEISLLLINIIWGVTFKYYFFVGRTDTLAHVWLTYNLIENGHVTEIFGVYKPFPLWQILCSYIHHILGLSVDIKDILFLTNGLIYMFIPLLTFLASYKLFKNNKLALLSALFLSLNSDIIFYGMYAVSRSVVPLLEILLFFLLLFEPYEARKTLLVIIITISLIIFHTASMPFLILIFILFYICQRFCKGKYTKKIINVNYLLLMFSMTLAYWMYYAGELFEGIVQNLFTPPTLMLISNVATYVSLNELFNYIQYTPLVFFVIYGALCAFNSRNLTNITKIFALLGLVLSAIAFPGPTLLFDKLFYGFNFTRFGLYSVIFISIVAAIGMFYLFYTTQTKAKYLIVCIFLIMTTLTVSNDFTATDNPLIKRDFFSFYLTEEEVISTDNLSRVAVNHVLADYVTTRHIRFSPHSDKSDLLKVAGNDFSRNNSQDIILIRNGELKKRPLYLCQNNRGASLQYYHKDIPLWESLIRYNNIYVSGDVTGYI